MARSIVWTPKAEADIRQAYAWYERQEPGLGDELTACIEAAVSSVAQNPELYPYRFDAVRRILIKRFPYAIYFESDRTSITVHYIFHSAQNPRRLSQRIKKTP